MSVSVFANASEIASKATTNKVIAAIPDVCKTPTPGGLIPIPYPNIMMASDTTKGVKVANSAGKILSTKKSTFSNKKEVISSATMGRYLGNIPLLTYVVDKAKKKGYKVVVVNHSGRPKLLVSNETNLQNKVPLFTVPLGDSSSANSVALQKAASFLENAPKVVAM